LENVEWGEFKLDELFEIVGTKSLDSNAINFTKTGINFVGRTFENNGIQGKIKKRDFEPNKPNTITATVIGNYKYVKFQTEPYYCSQNINKLTPKSILKKWDERIAYFFIASVQKFVSLYDGQQGGYKLTDIKNHIISVPTIKNEINFNFIENFVSELESERLAVYQEYLLTTGLNNYNLTENEQRAINEYNKLEWKEFKLETLFERIKTKKLPYKAKELPSVPIDKHTLPCLTSSFNNQGLNYFAPKDNATILKNVISIPSNSDVYRAYFQSNEFTVLSDSYAIQWIFNNEKLLPNQYLFAVQCINKVTDLPIYSYKNKLGGWNVVKNKHIQLPVKNDKPNYEIMNTLMSAIQKLIIKDVVLYVDRKRNK
jgi:hypothetical protein